MPDHGSFFSNNPAEPAADLRPPKWFQSEVPRVAEYASIRATLVRGHDDAGVNQAVIPYRLFHARSASSAQRNERCAHPVSMLLTVQVDVRLRGCAYTRATREAYRPHASDRFRYQVALQFLAPAMANTPMNSTCHCVGS